MTKPNFFIVGAPKSGTTALYQYLRQHPDVFMSRQKELLFFGSDQQRVNCVPYTLEQYLAFFRDTGGCARIGEASTSYLASTEAAREIKQFNPEAKIIIMLRSPLEVMVAYHSEMSYGGFEEIDDFAAALQAEPARKRGELRPRQPGILNNLFYRDVVRFSEQVPRYWSAFGEANTHVIIYDDFARDTPAVYRDTLQFLGVASDFQPEFSVVNANKRVRNRRLQQFVLQPPDVVAGFVRALLPEAVRDRARTRLRRLNTKQEARPPLEPTLRKALYVDLAADVERLGRLLGRDLSHWTRDPQPVERDSA